MQGPSGALHLCKHMLRSGGDARRWYSEFRREHGIEGTDRIHHELTCLTEVSKLFGEVDQVNMGRLSGIERLCRRILGAVVAVGVDVVYQVAASVLSLSLERSCGMVPGRSGPIQVRREAAAPSNSSRRLVPLPVCDAFLPTACRTQRCTPVSAAPRDDAGAPRDDAGRRCHACKYSQFSTCDRMYITWTLYTNIVPSLFVVFSVCPQTDTAQFYNTQFDLCMRTPHMDRTGLISTIVFSEKRVLS